MLWDERCHDAWTRSACVSNGLKGDDLSAPHAPRVISIARGRALSHLPDFQSPPESDQVSRCTWALADPRMRAYHDLEWGVPVHDDQRHFEFLVLEGAQAGLSWSTILNRRECYRNAFAGFDPEKVARFKPAKLAALLRDPGLIRNRRKMESAVTNARAFLKIQREFGRFDDYCWDFVGDRPRQNRWKSMTQIPASTPESVDFSIDLRKRGFSFVGPTIIYAHMQAVGMVNDHLVGCYRHSEVKDLAAPS